ncbi:muscle, skeletal receptor tyrosine protein kinase-like [Patiria miniata]|uniref:Receptor protein-tyrosine kinase n=1 Tax=Patiria miniata TaxID=46514 RepID=A0A914AMW6_PATMI|nr:muscle, skeletal receptor tyrosine protein kinase-like [Patiria miniata]
MALIGLHSFAQAAEVNLNVNPMYSNALSVRGKGTSQSSTINWGFHSSDKAIDGTTDTYSHTDDYDSHPWWLLDLGSEHRLDKINVTLRQDNWGFRFIGAIVRAGLSPNFAENLPCGSPATSEQSQNGAEIPFLCEPPRTARYISLDIDTSMPGVDAEQAYLQLAEVAVENSTSGEGSALPVYGKSTSQSTTWGYYPSDNAIDGMPDTFTHTNERDPHPLWLVDLGSKHCLGANDPHPWWLLHLGSKHCLGFRFIGAIARAGLSPNFNENLPCGSPATFQQSQSGATIPFLCLTPRTARYVSLDIDDSMPSVNPTTAFLQLAVVAVEEYTSGECADYVCSNPNPCRNGGTCIPETTGNFYNCSCPAGFSGGDCQNDVCSNPNPCQNGGTCIPDTTGNFYNCSCPAGFSGGNCQTDDPCMSNPCQNGGQCMPQAENMYNCTCQNGATGNNCQNAHSNTTTIIIIVVGLVVVLIVVLVIVVVCFVKRSRRKRRGSLPSAVDRGRGQELIQKKLSNIYWIDNRQTSTSEFNGSSKEFPRDKLHILGQLGSGSFAVVYKAEAEGIIRRGTNTTVAVKMLKESATPNDQSDFKKELRLYSMMDQHPNVLSMLGYCTDKDPMYVILEYVPHGDLQTYLRHIRTGTEPFYLKKEEFKEKKDLTPTEILSFASQVVRGMEYLASKQCIHRDLATRNILLGEGLICKVSDFGLAREVAEKSQYEMQSQGKVPVRWMAPESLLSNMYTSKSDVWSFGVLLWELVTLGSHPYPGMSSQEVINELKKGYRLPKPEHCGDDM